MLLGVHAKVVLGIATSRVSMEEGTVATVEDVDFRKGEVRILVSVLFAVLRAYKLGPVAVSRCKEKKKDQDCPVGFLHERCTMRRVLAVEHQQRVFTRRGLEETLGKLFLVTKVQSTFNVPTVVFILKAAVNDHLVVIQVVVNTIEYVNQSLTGDAREALWFASGKMGELEWVDIINIHY